MNKFIAAIVGMLFCCCAAHAGEDQCKKLAENFDWGLRVASPERAKKNISKGNDFQPTTSDIIQATVDEVADHGHFKAEDSRPSVALKNVVEKYDWATGIETNGGTWILSAVATNECRFFLVQYSKEPMKTQPDIVSAWELVAN